MTPVPGMAAMYGAVVPDATASLAATGAGIFGYGRAGMFDAGERARMAQIIATARSVLAPVSTSSAPVSLPGLPENRFKELLAGLAREFDVSENFITAVMFAESGGDPRAVGDNGHSVGLFQLHDRGMGHGMGDDRYDPEKNARVGVAGLAGSWHDGLAKGLTGEELVRFAYDQRFNPGGGWAYQGDRVVGYWRALEAATAVSRPGESSFAPHSLAWPVQGGRLTQSAHNGHMALDIGVVVGTPVRAVAAGTVVEVERLTTGYGWYVVVDHGGGWRTRYAHASAIDVGVGDSVSAGQVIMSSGNTGKSTGPHLHFEIERNGERQDPMGYLRPR
jgi:murein DD-endopeptidase MepM/ murein hydrolase activator NlpD